MALSVNKFLVGCLRGSGAAGLNVVQVRTHMGYIPHEGRFGPDPNTHVMMFKIQRKLVNLQPVKSVAIAFDPFTKRIADVRSIMYTFSMKSILDTNKKVIVKNEIKTDRSPPTLKVELNDGRKVTFKMDHLSDIEVLREYNRIVLPLVKTERELQAEMSSSSMASKMSKKGKK